MLNILLPWWGGFGENGMPVWRDMMISAGFAAFRATGVHNVLAPWTRRRGAILMFHHVRPAEPKAFAPNQLLEITPEFLEAVITLARARGFDIVTMDDALLRISRPGAKPFVVLTFDDGYWDNRDHALPVLKRQNAPFLLYVTTGFAERTARLWWRELEAAVRVLDGFTVTLNGRESVFTSGTDAEKSKSFEQVYWLLRKLPEPEMLMQISRLCEMAKVSSKALVASACMDWKALAHLSQEPLCTIGVHTLTHPMLAKHDAAIVRYELAESRGIIEARLGKAAHHLSYPVGDPTSAGEREFTMAAQLGFASAVTTRPGMILSAHARHLTALPRLSINGKWQDIARVDVLLSGAPFAVLNRGRAA